MIWIIISYGLLVGYIFLIDFYNRHWRAASVVKLTAGASPKKISLVIPARNEALKIASCIESALAQHSSSGPLDILVVDDHSTDETSSVVNRYQQQGVRLISMNEVAGDGKAPLSFKKKALSAGIAAAAGEWILTTDADCVAGQEWLSTFSTMPSDLVFIAAPVRMKPGKSFLSIFQSLDFAILQGITAASINARFHPMCNGANMCYQKKVFDEVGGYAGDELASGDDMLLLHKIVQRYPDRIGYLFSSDAIVDTLPEPDWRRFFSQRIRWASKTGRYGDNRLSGIWLGVYALNFFMAFVFIYACFRPFYFQYFILLLLLKTGIEWKFVKRVLRFYQLSHLMKWFLPLQLVHIFYITITGILSRFASYQWKGRKIR